MAVRTQPVLAVREVRASARWYATLLNAERTSETLCDAIENHGSLALVEEALGEGAAVNQEVRRDAMVSPLALAMRSFFRGENAKVIGVLLRAGADPHHPIVIAELLTGARDNELYDAAARELFANGGTIPSNPPIGATFPASLASPEILDLMLTHGLDPNATAEMGSLKPSIRVSALCEACWRGGFARAEVLVRRGADASYVVPHYGLTALHFAVLSEDAAQLVPLPAVRPLVWLAQRPRLVAAAAPEPCSASPRRRAVGSRRAAGARLLREG